MENNKILSMIGLATRAGKTASGEFAVETAVKNKSAKLVFIAETASDNTRNKFENKCRFHKIPVVICFNKEELGKATGKDIRTTVAVLDDGFAQAILKMLN